MKKLDNKIAQFSAQSLVRFEKVSLFEASGWKILKTFRSLRVEKGNKFNSIIRNGKFVTENLI
jgi:hypothetical protein